jgi:hypothetical protein
MLCVEEGEGVAVTCMLCVEGEGVLCIYWMLGRYGRKNIKGICDAIGFIANFAGNWVCFG